MQYLCSKRTVNRAEAAVSCQRSETKNKATTDERGRGVASECYDVTPVAVLMIHFVCNKQASLPIIQPMCQKKLKRV